MVNSAPRNHITFRRVSHNFTTLSVNKSTSRVMAQRVSRTFSDTEKHKLRAAPSGEITIEVGETEMEKSEKKSQEVRKYETE